MLVPLVSKIVSGFEFSNAFFTARRGQRRPATAAGGDRHGRVNPPPDLPLSRVPQRLPALGRNKHTQNSTVVQFQFSDFSGDMRGANAAPDRDAWRER
jgi:hypothetical protein